MGVRWVELLAGRPPLSYGRLHAYCRRRLLDRSTTRLSCEAHDIEIAKSTNVLRVVAKRCHQWPTRTSGIEAPSRARRETHARRLCAHDAPIFRGCRARAA